jgi:hypothetical protein
MTAPRPGGPQQGGGGVPSAVRGAVLVGLAVIVGIVGLQILDDSSPGSGASNAVIGTIAPSGSTVTTVASGTGAPATTVAGNTTAPTTAAKVRNPSNVKVKVYNASDTSGVAQAMTDRLKAAGYNTLPPANLDKTRTGYVVTCRSGFENEGKLLAIYQVKSNATYEAFPNNPPQGSGDADCLVILGKPA